MACLVQWLKFSGARDLTGAPVSSGKAYFWQQGTSDTAVSIWADEDATTALVHPVALDAAGRAEVYVDGRCSVEIQTSTGSQVSVTNESTGVDAANVTVYNSAYDTSIGGTGTDLASVLDVINAAGLGNTSIATGVIVADPTANNFDTLVDTAAASGKILFLPPGTYTSSRASTGSNISYPLHVMGCGAGTSIISFVSTAGTPVTPFPLSGVSTALFAGFSITGTNSGGDAHPFALLGNCSGIDFERIFVTTNSEPMLRTTSASFSACEFSDVHCTGSASINIPTGCGSNRISQCEGTLTVASTLNRVYGHIGDITLSGADNTLMSPIGAVTWSAGADSCVAYSGYATGKTNGYNLGAVANSGCVNCTGASNTTDFRTAAGTTSVIDCGNSFTTRVRAEYGGDNYMSPRQWVISLTKTTGTGTGGYTPDPSNAKMLIYRDLATVGASTLTVAATQTAGVQNGQRMEMVICNPAAGTMTISWNAQYVGAMLTSLATGKYARFVFLYNTNTSKWDCLEIGASTTYTTGLFT